MSRRWLIALVVLAVIAAGLLLWTGRARAAADPEELPDSGPTGEPDAELVNGEVSE